MTTQPESAPASAPTPAPSIFGRFVAVFARPSRAWEGLRERQQWWFPLLLVAVLNLGFISVVYERALLPDMLDQWQAQVEAGRMPPAQFDKMEAAAGTWAMKGTIFAFAPVGYVVVTLVFALIASFGVSFILGAKLPFRLALEVVSWSGLVKIVEYPLVLLLAWTSESMKAVHLSLAALLPASDPPAKWHAAVNVVLDAFGPFNVWFFVVGVIGCSVLSGAPRRNVAWVLGGLGLALVAIAALFSGCSPGA